MRIIGSLAALVVLTASMLLGSATPASARGDRVDPRWVPWVGCWQLITESSLFGGLDPAEALAGTTSRPARPSNGAEVCVSPAGQPGAVVQATIVGGQPVLEDTVVADGNDRSIDEAGCQGSRRATWSESGRMLFGTAALACGDQPLRRISSLAFLLAGPTWLDIQMIDIGGRKSLRVRRYQHARDHAPAGGLLAAEGARTPDPDVLTLEDVVEASGKVAPEVVEAALVTVRPRFPLNRHRLVALADAGVHERVIDLMVALAFPERFVVDRASGEWESSGGWGGPWDWSDAAAWISLSAPFGYGYWGHYDPIYGPGWGWVPIAPGPPATPGTHGRVVDGLGYTRVRPREAVPITGSGSGGSSGTRSGGGDSSSGTTGSSGVTSSGYSSGSSGSSGRTAQPRPPG